MSSPHRDQTTNTTTTVVRMLRTAAAAAVTACVARRRVPTLALLPATATARATAARVVVHRTAVRFTTTTTTRPPSPVDELTQLRTLILTVSGTNSVHAKTRYLSTHARALFPLLSFLYDPRVRLHVTSATLQRYLAQRAADDVWQAHTAPVLTTPSAAAAARSRRAALRAHAQHAATPTLPHSLLDLFRALHTRQITGNRALATLTAFLDHHGILAAHQRALQPPPTHQKSLVQDIASRPTLLDIFYRCLDRNLKAGFADSILRSTFQSASASASASHSHSQASVAPSPSRFQVALARTVHPHQLAALFTPHPTPVWYASRKVDGVRCIVTLDFDTASASADSQPSLTGIRTLSRTGRELHTLAQLKHALRHTLASPAALATVRELLASSRARGDTDTRLVLDGEVCHAPVPGSAYADDFNSIASEIMRKEHTVASPLLFAFDLLTGSEFASGTGQRLLATRLEALRSLFPSDSDYAAASASAPGIRVLEQVRVTDVAGVEAQLSRASTDGWEGVMLRRDVAYEGKRTSALRKCKRWQDAEYTVLATDVARMRLSLDGVYTDTHALSSITIEHKGTRVRVGSGLTTRQRIEYAQHPERIIGATVTVEYFDESHSAQRAASETSLRFPRIKYIYPSLRGRDI